MPYGELRSSFRAIESITAFRVVSVAATTAANYCEQADTSTSMPLGIAQDNASTNGAVDVITFGRSFAQCGASVSAGGLIGWLTAAGSIINVTVNTSTAQDRSIGIALQSGSTDSVIQIHVNPGLVDYT